MGLLRRRLNRRLTQAYMREIERFQRVGYFPSGDHSPQAVADIHRRAFRRALRDVGEPYPETKLRHFKSAAEVQAAEQVCIGMLSSVWKLRPDEVPTGGWPIYGPGS